MAKKKHKHNKGAPSRQENPAVTPAQPQGIFSQYAVVAAFVIVVASFFTHLYGADFTHRKRITTVDESVYSRLGLQLKEGLEYSTVSMFNENLRAGRQLPAYFKDPLFKHPPFYSFLISLSYTFLEKKPNYSFEELYALSSKVSNLMGCLLIFTVFLLGRTIYDYRVGLLAAFILAIEVNLLNCSQKVWMESTLAAMFWLAVYFFYKGKDQPWYFILWGISGGLALLTKYPAVLVFISTLTYAALVERKVFKSFLFYIGLFIAGILFLPWILTNIEHYGRELFIGNTFRGWVFSRFDKFFYLILGFGAAFFILFILKKKSQVVYEKISRFKSTAGFLLSVALSFSIVYLIIQPDFRESLFKSLTWHGYPKTGWAMGSFNEEPWYFYIKHILEYSPFYIFFFIGMVKAPLGSKGDGLLLSVAFWTLAFTSFYGNYQGRYILYFTPAAVLLSVRVIIDIFNFLLKKEIGAQRAAPLRLVAASLFAVALLYFAAKTAQVSWFHAMTDNVAYY
ncbi:MAG TPA: glycosyltransferase family 39 protein [Candidatus Omnitrophota bacterium]|nr:glycosyltransferase family 39 protein [Candidatus Omnitrophota bacterium]